MIEQGTKVSVNDFIVKACAAALKVSFGGGIDSAMPKKFGMGPGNF